MKKFKLLVLVLIVALGVTACSTDKTPNKKEPAKEPGQEIGKEPAKDPAASPSDDNLKGNELLKNVYENRAKKVSYDAVGKVGEMEVASKYYIDGESYRIETDGYISIFNSDEKKLYTYDTKTMEGTIQAGDNIPSMLGEFQPIDGLTVAEIRDYEGQKELYVESVGESEGKEFVTKSWISKKYYINLKGEGTQDGVVVSSIESSNISDDFDSKVMFQEPEGIDFKEAK